MKRNKWVIAALLIASFGAHAAESETYAGLPRSAEALQVLRNPGFVIGYSARQRQPAWVAFRAAALKGGHKYKRDNRFEPDPRVERPVTHWDYTGTGYTRGHLAPAYLIGRLYGRAAQGATFLMTNISPQRARLNTLVWERLEEAESHIVAPAAIDLWVVTGPIFDGRRVLKKSGIALPDAFYRIWLDLRDGVPHALGFVVPQEVCGTEPLSRYLTSVDDIERRTALDFFSELDNKAEAALEAVNDPAGWDVPRYDQLPPRYATGNLDCTP